MFRTILRVKCRTPRSLFVPVAIVMLASRVLAQQYQINTNITDGGSIPVAAAGSPAGSYLLSGFDTVNLYNGKLSVVVPLLKVGGRGEAGYTISVPVQQDWTIQTTYDTTQTPPLLSYTPVLERSGIDPYGPGIMQPEAGLQVAQICDLNVQGAVPSYASQTLTRLAFVLPDGTRTELVDQNTGGQIEPYGCQVNASGVRTGFSRGTVFVSRDGSATTFVSDTAVTDAVVMGLGHPAVSGVLMFRNGVRYRIDQGNVTWIRDRNGNQVSFQYGNPNSDPINGNAVISILDTLNRVITVSRGATQDRISFQGANGVQRNIYVNRGPQSSAVAPCIPSTGLPTKSCGNTSATFTDLFGIYGGDANCKPNNVSNQTVVTSIVLPNGRSYQLAYNDYAEVAQITLPTGGKFLYSYGSGDWQATQTCTPQGNSGPGQTESGGVILGNGGPGNNPFVYRRVLTRDVSADGSTIEQHTAYSVAPDYFVTGNNSYPALVVTVDHYDGLHTAIGAAPPTSNPMAHEVHHFIGSPDRPAVFPQLINYAFWPDGKEYQTDQKSADGSATLRSAVQTWAQRPCAGAGNSDVCLGGAAMPNSSNTNLDGSFSPSDPRILQVQTTLSDTNQVTLETYSFSSDPYNNKTDVFDFDYGNGSFGSLLRHTHTSFLSSWPATTGYDSLTGTHLPSLVAEETVYDGLNNQVADTQYCYDDKTGGNCRTPVTLATHPNPIAGWTDPQTTHRGNIATIARWLNTSGGYVAASSAYDVAGNVVSSTDGNGNQTTYAYDDSFSTSTTLSNSTLSSWSPQPPCFSGCNAYAFLTKTTNALGQSLSASYDYYIGKPTSSTDLANGPANNPAAGPTTTYSYAASSDPSGYEPLDRMTGAHYPDGGSVSFTYSDSANTITTQTAITAASSSDTVCGNLSATTKQNDLLYDGLGRTSRTVAHDAIGLVFSDSKYDGMGRSGQVSNPYQSGSSVYWTTTSYDGLSRAIQVQTLDSAAVITGYSGNQTTVRDQAGKWRQSQTDALGRVKQVTEDPAASITLGSITYQNPPAGASALNQLTSYVYDGLDNLIGVCHGGSYTLSNGVWVCSSGLSRAFIFDSLKRLYTAQNLENGSIQYRYDSNGNLHTKQDARFTATILYDKLDRIIQKSYTDPNTQTVSLCYDGQSTASTYDGASVITCAGANSLSGVNAVRRLTFETNGNSSSAYNSFDSLGRVLSHTQTTASVSYPFQYRYNLAGQLEVQTYPSGRKVASCYDVSARPSTVKNGVTTNSASYGTVNQYTPHGAIAQLTLGNNLVETTTYEPTRLQPTRIAAGSMLTLGYTYAPVGSPTSNNGSVITQTITRGGSTWNQSYSYDVLNRLKTAQESGAGSWTESYEYDPVGNRWLCVSGQGCSDPVRSGLPDLTSETPINQGAYNSKNQLVGWGYDSSGNVIQVAGMARSFTYDAENRQITGSAGGSSNTYQYDGDGRRVIKNVVWGQTTQTTYYVYDASGQLAAEYGPPSEGGTSYLTADALGSTRLETNSNGVLIMNYDYLPFGEEIGAGTAGRDSTFSPASYPGTASGPSLRFTSKERDAETGLDYFNARYYSGAQGRFTAPDWSPIQQPIPYANLKDPQTLNLYAYVRNDPLSKSDFDGHGWWQKFKNLFGDAACYCEGEEAERRARDFRIRRSQLNKPLTEHQRSELNAYVTTTIIYGVTNAIAEEIVDAASGNAAIEANEAAAEAGTALATINGRLPINSRYAGGTHPSGVTFTPQGFPDFSPNAVAEVEITGLTGNYAKDAAMANRAAGFSSTPDGYVWHHVEDGKTMQLVPQDIHNEVRHTGGAAIIRNGGVDKK